MTPTKLMPPVFPYHNGNVMLLLQSVWSNGSMFDCRVRDTRIESHHGRLIFGRLFVKQFALCYWTILCLSVCLSVCRVTLVYCGQMVGKIKVPLGTEVGLSPGHTVLDGNPAPSMERGIAVYRRASV